MWICKKCNSMNANDQSKFCPKCGKSIEADDPASSSFFCQSRQPWEYKVVYVDCGIALSIGGRQDITKRNLEKTLAKEGPDGWELVSVVGLHDSISYLVATFKRPVQ